MPATALAATEIAAPTLTGIVEKIDFTSGGAGNQWTTINGVRYATWWHFNQGVHVGSTVTYRPFREPFWHGQPPVLSATILSVEASPTPAAKEPTPTPG